MPCPPFVHPATMAAIWGLEWNHPIDVMFGWQVEGEIAHPYDDINDKYNRARATVLQGDYDALLTVEADMLIPSDALQRLAAVDADVAYGLYCSRHNRSGRPDGYKWLAFQYASEAASISWSAHPRHAIRRKVWGKVAETHGLGFGCTLIHRHVLAAFPFRTHATHAVSNDWMFSLDCQAHGFKQAHDFGLVCGHILSDGVNAIWPDIDAEHLYSIRSISHGISYHSGVGDAEEEAAFCAEERQYGVGAT